MDGWRERETPEHLKTYQGASREFHKQHLLRNKLDNPSEHYISPREPVEDNGSSLNLQV